MIKTFLYPFIFLLLPIIGASQDLIFSQYYNAPLMLNPAFAGNSIAPQFNLNYRLQWPGITQTYETFHLGYNQYFSKIRSGFGLTAFGDSAGAGTIKKLYIGGTYMYKVVLLNNWQLKLGIEAGYNQTSLDWDKLIFYDQVDPVNGLPEPGTSVATAEVRPDDLSRGYMDISSGLLIYNQMWYAGVSFRHINSPDASFLNNSTVTQINQGLPILLNVHTGFQLLLDEGNNRTKPTFISPSLIFAKQADFTQLNGGVHLQVRSLILGASYRHTITNSDAVILSFGAALDKIKINYSFDLTTSQLGLSSGGSHEIGIIVNLDGLVKEQSKLNDCFLLFR